MEVSSGGSRHALESPGVRGPSFPESPGGAPLSPPHTDRSLREEREDSASAFDDDELERLAGEIDAEGEDEDEEDDPELDAYLQVCSCYNESTGSMAFDSLPNLLSNMLQEALALDEAGGEDVDLGSDVDDLDDYIDSLKEES